jgi:hypothetical protein
LLEFSPGCGKIPKKKAGKSKLESFGVVFIKSMMIVLSIFFLFVGLKIY